MIPRYPEQFRTKKGLYCKHIVGATNKFPLLHAFGIGLEPFKDFSDEQKQEVLVYAKYLLSHCLDLEADWAMRMIDDLGRPEWDNSNPFYVSSDYIQMSYEFWRKQHSRTKELPRHMPVGPIILSALLNGNRVLVSHATKPHALISVLKTNFRRRHKYLVEELGMPDWDLDTIQMKSKIEINSRDVESDSATDMEGDMYGNVRSKGYNTDG